MKCLVDSDLVDDIKDEEDVKKSLEDIVRLLLLFLCMSICQERERERETCK